MSRTVLSWNSSNYVGVELPFATEWVADQHEANTPNGTINYVKDNKRHRNTIKTCKQIRLTSGL